MTVSHEWPALTDLSGTPSHSATIRDVLLPSIKGRLEVQVYAATSSLPAAGDFSGQLAAVGSAAPYTYFSWTGVAWRVFGVPEFATTSARDAVITSPTVNDRCLVGSGTAWTEYRHNGSAWKIWNLVDASSMLTVSVGQTVTLTAVVSCGELRLEFQGTRTAQLGAAAVDTKVDLFTINAAIAPARTDIIAAPLYGAVTSGQGHMGDFACYIPSSGAKLQFLFMAPLGPYIANGGWFHGRVSWVIA